MLTKKKQITSKTNSHVLIQTEASTTQKTRKQMQGIVLFINTNNRNQHLHVIRLMIHSRMLIGGAIMMHGRWRTVLRRWLLRRLWKLLNVNQDVLLVHSGLQTTHLLSQLLHWKPQTIQSGARRRVVVVHLLEIQLIITKITLIFGVFLTFMCFLNSIQVFLEIYFV